MEHTQHDLQSSSREVGKHKVLLSRGSQESVLPSRPSLDTQRNHPLCQASSSSGQGHGERVTGNDFENLHSGVQQKEDCLPHSLGQGERDLVVGFDSGGMCHVSEHCPNLEEYPPVHRLIRPRVGSCPLRPGDVLTHGT